MPHDAPVELMEVCQPPGGGPHRVITIARDQTLCLWDPYTAARVFNLDLDMPCTSMAVHEVADAQWRVAVAGIAHVMIIDLAEGRVLHKLSLGRDIVQDGGGLRVLTSEEGRVCMGVLCTDGVSCILDVGEAPAPDFTLRSAVKTG
jgi:hypothetical protein